MKMLKKLGLMASVCGACLGVNSVRGGVRACEIIKHARAIRMTSCSNVSSELKKMGAEKIQQFNNIARCFENPDLSLEDFRNGINDIYSIFYGHTLDSGNIREMLEYGAGLVNGCVGPDFFKDWDDFFQTMYREFLGVHTQGLL